MVNGLTPGFNPMNQAVQGLAHHPAIDGRHDVVALRRGDKLGRRHDGSALVPQSQHQLEVLPLLRPRLDRHNGLVETIRSGSRRGHAPAWKTQCISRWRSGMSVRLVELDAISARILGRIARHVGGAHDIGDGRNFMGDLHDADARANREHPALPRKSIVAYPWRRFSRDAQRPDPGAQSCSRIPKLIAA